MTTRLALRIAAPSGSRGQMGIECQDIVERSAVLQQVEDQLQADARALNGRPSTQTGGIGHDSSRDDDIV
jgi:hypothetical protein